MTPMLQRIIFGLMYRIGFTPWDGHPLPARLRALVEGPDSLPPGRAIDLGCGTGDTSIYLARHGWNVTALDFVEVALKRARAKAAAANASVNWIHGDVTRLTSYGIAPGVRLCVDSGCLHGLPDDARESYARELNAIAAPDATLLIAAFADKPDRRGPRGIDRAEIERRFAGEWRLMASHGDGDLSHDRGDVIYVHELRRV